MGAQHIGTWRVSRTDGCSGHSVHWPSWFHAGRCIAVRRTRVCDTSTSTTLRVLFGIFSERVFILLYGPVVLVVGGARGEAGRHGFQRDLDILGITGTHTLRRLILRR